MHRSDEAGTAISPTQLQAEHPTQAGGVKVTIAPPAPGTNGTCRSSDTCQQSGGQGDGGRCENDELVCCDAEPWRANGADGDCDNVDDDLDGRIDEGGQGPIVTTPAPMPLQAVFGTAPGQWRPTLQVWRRRVCSATPNAKSKPAKMRRTSGLWQWHYRVQRAV